MKSIQAKHLASALGLLAAAAWMVVAPVRAGATSCTPSGNYTTLYPSGSIFYISNNPYGDEGSTTNGVCVVQVSTSGSHTAAWYTQWKQNESNNYSVYGYPEIVFPGGNASSGLPIALSSISSIPSVWNYQLQSSNPDGFDVAYDIWAGNTPTTTSSTEIMIWTNAAFGQDGTNVGTFSDGGLTFTLYQTLPQYYSWTNHPVYSFCSQTQVSSVNIDINKFLQYLVSKGYVPSNWYLQSVDAGIEIRNGNGSLNTTEYNTYLVTGSGSGTPITPYIQVNNGNWQSTNAVTVSPGASVNLGPQPLSGGSWSWTGPKGYTSTSRQIDNIPLSTGANSYVATYTNSSGVKSTETFTITVN